LSHQYEKHGVLLVVTDKYIRAALSLFWKATVQFGFKGVLADKRIYLVEGSAERAKPAAGKLFNGTSLNADEIRTRIGAQVQDKAKFEKKWKWAPKDADAFSGILTGWAKVMGTTATDFLERTQSNIIDGVFDKKLHAADDPHPMIDLKPEAQFMRWSAGAGASANFMPFQGDLHDDKDTDWASRVKRGLKSAQFGLEICQRFRLETVRGI
jgi:hypothetical protein